MYLLAQHVLRPVLPFQKLFIAVKNVKQIFSDSNIPIKTNPCQFILLLLKKVENPHTIINGREKNWIVILSQHRKHCSSSIGSLLPLYIDTLTAGMRSMSVDKYTKQCIFCYFQSDGKCWKLKSWTPFPPHSKHDILLGNKTQSTLLGQRWLTAIIWRMFCMFNR